MLTSTDHPTFVVAGLIASIALLIILILAWA